MKAALLFITFLLLKSPCAFASGTNCGASLAAVGNSLNYCTYPGSVDRVVIFFNGYGNTEAQWNLHYKERLTKSFAELKRAAPSVLSIGLGRANFLSGAPLDHGLDDIDQINQSVFAIIDKLTEDGFISPSAQYILMGESMGGFNALQVFTRHSEHFSKLVLMCAAGTRVSPFASNAEWEKNRQEEHGDWVHATAFRTAMQNTFISAANWDANSPLNFLRTSYRQIARQPVYVSHATKDEYGFNKVQFETAAVFKAQGHPTIIDSAQGGHCVYNALPLAKFLTD